MADMANRRNQTSLRGEIYEACRCTYKISITSVWVFDDAWFVSNMAKQGEPTRKHLSLRTYSLRGVRGVTTAKKEKSHIYITVQPLMRNVVNMAAGATSEKNFLLEMFHWTHC